MEIKRLDRCSINKKLCIFLVFLAIIIPIVVGVLVWHFTKSHYEPNAEESRGRPRPRPRPRPEPVTFTIEEATFPLTTQISKTEPWTNKRLPRDLTPVHYDINLYPDIYDGNSWFYGYETIEIDVGKETPYIIIHSFNLNVTNHRLSDFWSGNSISVSQIRPYPENQYLVIETSRALAAGSKVSLHLEFDGSLSGNNGIFKTTYFNTRSNRTSEVLSSLFEPVKARTAFPCFDEPDMKAEFTVTLVYKSGFTALSNMPEDKTEQSRRYPGRLQTRYRRSVKMSTYLVCFVVGEFLYSHTTSANNVKLRVYATPDKLSQTRYPLAAVNHTMAEYEQLFGLKYPLPKQGKLEPENSGYSMDIGEQTIAVYEQLFSQTDNIPKLDMVAIPDYVVSGMEHWGLITYSEVRLLYDEEDASGYNQQRSATLIAHEVAHQWFGNIVTMEWWNDLWLNEGFASFMEYIGLRNFEKSWDMDSQILPLDYQPAMIRDASPSSHPVITRVYDADEAVAAFDMITYKKGASVINMLEKMLGHERFFRGIQAYLKAYEWGNARTEDLWRILSGVPGSPDVGRIMDTWTRQMGYPLVTVSLISDGPNTTIRLQQRRFLKNAQKTFDPAESPYRYKWFISADYSSSYTRNMPLREWMNMTDVVFSLPFDLTKEGQWIKFNWMQAGFYRVNYPEFMWRRLSEKLRGNRRTEIQPIDRAGLLSDALNLARSGIIDYGIALDMLQYMQQEIQYVPWATIDSDLLYITDMLKSGNEFTKWKLMVLKIVKPIADRLGWDTRGSHLQKLLRSVLVDIACLHNDDTCLENAKNNFRRWIREGETIPPSLRKLAYKYGMRSGGTSSDWDFMWNKYKAAVVPQERLKLLRGLSNSRESWILTRLLDYTKDKSKIPSQDVFKVLAYVSDNPAGETLVWDWVRTNWQHLVDRYSVSSNRLANVVERIVSRFNTEFHLYQVIAFFKAFPNAGAGARGRKRAIETIRENIAWMTNRKSEVTRWLSRNIS